MARTSPGRNATAKVARVHLRAGKAEHDSGGSHHHRSADGDGKADQRRGTAGARRLVGQDPGTHPRKEGAHHPPHRVIPPVAAATDLIPAVGVGADVLQQGNVDQEENARRGEPDAGGTRNAFDGARPGPQPRQQGDGRQPGNQDDSTDEDLQRCRRESAKPERRAAPGCSRAARA